MPVELKELVVKATVRQGENSQSENPQRIKADLDEQQRAGLIRDCVETVMEILNEKYHR